MIKMPALKMFISLSSIYDGEIVEFAIDMLKERRSTVEVYLCKDDLMTNPERVYSLKRFRTYEFNTRSGPERTARVYDTDTDVSDDDFDHCSHAHPTPLVVDNKHAVCPAPSRLDTPRPEPPLHTPEELDLPSACSFEPQYRYSESQNFTPEKCPNLKGKWTNLPK
jgi:hypothetical protein